MALGAMIFDVDGTLIDSNALHAEAFHRAFAAHGYRVLPDRIAVEIGKGGDTLVPAILGRSADAADGDAIRRDQPKRFAELATAQGLAIFPQARELLAAVRRRGMQVVIATSSGPEQIDTLERLTGWAFTRDADVVVKADDAATSKPAPDLVAAAVARAGVSPAQCAMVGDTPYDATAAGGAGVVTLGVLCGGNAASVLRAAGARRVYRDPADLLARLDAALMAASPASRQPTREILELAMGGALDAAREALAEGEMPVGCVLAGAGDGVAVARGHHAIFGSGDWLAHGERAALAAAGHRLPVDGPGLMLVTTLEPCVMCLGAAMEANVDTVVFALRSPVDGGSGRIIPPVGPLSTMPRIVGGVRAAESLELFRQWNRRFGGNDAEQAEFARQLRAAQDGSS